MPQSKEKLVVTPAQAKMFEEEFGKEWAEKHLVVSKKLESTPTPTTPKEISRESIDREFGILFVSKEIGQKDTAKVYADPKDILTFFHQKYAEVLESVIPEEVTYADGVEMIKNCITDKAGYAKYGYNNAIREIKSRIKKVIGK